MATPVVTPWYRSNTVQGAAWIVVAAVAGALVPMLQAKNVDGWSLATTFVAALLVAGKRMFDPDVVGPLPAMNKNNLVSGGG